MKKLVFRFNNQGRQDNFDALIQFIHDAKSIGGVIDLPINTPISFSGDMNLVGYSEQYYTIINGTISDTVTFGNGGFPDWDNTALEDQICYFNEKDIAYTWDKSNPSAGDFPPGRLDFVFFTNSVMSVDKSFIISTEDMSPSLLTQNNLFWDDTKKASDHFPVIVDFVFQTINPTGVIDEKSKKDIIHIKDLLGRTVEQQNNIPLFYLYDDGTVEKRIVVD